ncbi:MAG: arginyl-tRNA synthetase [Acidobacteriota bacterium]|nr:arginyl-tRNA synthetase [Acidobacteriota bacterium]
MNLIELQQSLRERVRAAAADKFGVELEQVASEVPPRTPLGDLAFPVAFELAKRIKQATGEKRNPRAIAEELRQELQAIEEVARVEVAGAGYLNLFYDRARLLARLSASASSLSDSASSLSDSASQGDAPPATLADDERPKRMVEHTSVNPNKAAHIGHLRNSVIGDTFVRILRANGERVEVHNYIDNTGVQVADVVVGFVHLEHMSLADVRALDASLTQDHPFDYYCWDLYARVGLFYRGGDPDAKEDPERLKLRVETLHALEAGDNATAALADYVATRIVNRHLDTMARLGITYDLLPRESEVLHFLWSHAFERMKESGAIRFEAEGRNKGCWVMPMEMHEGSDEHEADKIVVRSNGTVTYTGKDIAYQLWKLGQVDLNFYFKPFRTDDAGRTVWTTTSDAGEAAEAAPHFGAGATVYNVIDSRQAYPQEVVKRGVASIAPRVGERASVHLSYEMVALSPAAAEELGLELSTDERARPFVEMSGRRGLGVKADDLIDTLEANALKEVAERHPEVSLAEQQRAAHILAVGALRYFLMKWTRNSVIVFDFKEALSTKGEAGPYCQYAAVRANSIFRKLPAEELSEANRLVGSAVQEGGETTERVRAVFEGEVGNEIWSLVMLAARLPEVIAQAAAIAEPSQLAKYAFQLAQAFNFFYNRDENRILEERNAVRRSVLVYVTDYVRTQLTSALDILGIEVPERM